ncbi:MAG: hypothetical protein ABSD61_01285 [Terracidiphilus sp.]
MTIPVGMEVGAGTGPGVTGAGVETGAGASTWAGGAIAAFERAGSAAQGQAATFVPGKGTGASWQSMLRAWGMVARTNGDTMNQAASETADTGATTGIDERPGVESAQAAFARAGAHAAQPAPTTNQGNGPVAGAAAAANNAAGAIGPRSPSNAASVAASAQGATAIRAAGFSGSSTGTSPSVKGEKRANETDDAGAQQNVVQGTNGLPSPPAAGAGLAVSVAPVQPQITSATLADSLSLAKQIDGPSSGASETEPEAAIAAIRAKGSPSITTASTATNSGAGAPAASPAQANAAQNSLRDEETSGCTPTLIGEQAESAAQPRFSSTAPEVAVAGPSRVRSATRQSGLGASSGIDEHRTLSGEFEPHRGASAMDGASADPAVATASADKLSGDSDTSHSPQSMARSAHEAVAGGVITAAGQGIGTHVVVGQQTSATEASAIVRDTGGAQGTTAARGEPAPTDVAAPRETFAALDAGTSVGTPSWIHAGGHQAEAGFEDPALGWIGVRADLSGNSVHAALVPGSVEAAQALSGHLAGLNAYLAEQHAPVAPLTMAAPGSSGMEAGVNQNMQQSAGQHGEQNPGAAPQSGVQPDAGASGSATAMSMTATNGEFDAFAYAGGNRGMHISVMA